MARKELHIWPVLCDYFKTVMAKGAILNILTEKEKTID